MPIYRYTYSVNLYPVVDASYNGFRQPAIPEFVYSSGTGVVHRHVIQRRVRYTCREGRYGVLPALYPIVIFITTTLNYIYTF